MPVIHQIEEVPMEAHIHNHPYNGDAPTFTPTAPNLRLTGIKPGPAVPGIEIVIMNGSTTESFTVGHNDGSSDADARIFFPTGADFVLGPQRQVWGTRRDDANGPRWVMEQV